MNNLRIKNGYTLISDFDNTIYFYDRDNDITIKKLNAFAKSNYLCINTGKSYKSMEKIKPSIKFDYLISNNGTEIYDKDYNLIYYKTMDEYDKKVISNYKFYKTTEIKKYIPKGIDDKDENTSLLLIEYDEKKFNNLIDYFTKELRHTHLYVEYPYIKFINDYCNKYLGVKYLIDHNYIDSSSAYCIGDDDNDYELLSHFDNSASMVGSSERIKDLNLPEYNDIFDYIKYIENKEKNRK